MKIVFFGSSEFAVPSLKALLNSPNEILAVVTQPDREKGRDRKMAATPIKVEAVSRKIKLFQPENLSDPACLNDLASLNADLFVVVSFGQILPKAVLDIPKLYSINLHPSLLPKYRGAAPMNWAIIKGETKTGFTVIKMNEKMDAGDIILQRKVAIEREDTSGTLGKRLAGLGGFLLLDAIRFIKEDKAKFKAQKARGATFAPKLKKEDGLIDWGKPAIKIHNRIRGVVPWPGAFTFLEGKMLKVWKTETVPLYKKSKPGEIIEVRPDGLIVACAKDALIVKEVQSEGGKRMNTADFLRGHPVEKGTVLGENLPAV